MKIFWSWQSDSPGNIGRHFVREVLETTLTELNQELQIHESERIELDHDRKGVAGSPDLVATILKKIDESDVFIADVTPVGKNVETDRQLLNSNVAIELGYALGKLSDARLLMILNTHFGERESLPFDLRHKSGPIMFKLGPTADKDEKQRARTELIRDLKVALKVYLKEENQKPSGWRSHKHPKFRLVDLGTLGGLYSRARAINSHGHVVGNSTLNANRPEHAFYHDGMTMRDLGAIGPTNSGANDINNFDVIVGMTTTRSSPSRGGPPYSGFVWKKERMVELPTLGGTEANALGINESGLIVGQAYKEDGTFAAFLYVNGSMIGLPPLNPDKPYASAASINSTGIIVGTAMASDGEYHAVTWEDSKICDLGTLGGRTSAALDINASGQIVGRSGATSGKQRAFMYASGEMIELGALAGADSTANAINNAGLAVGRSSVTSGEHHAVLFIDREILDLNLLVDNLGEFVLTEATDINDRLEIVGSAYFKGAPRAFKLVLHGNA